MSASFDPRSFTPWIRGHLFEDFAPGQKFEHHWGRTLTAGDGTLFTTIAMRHCPLYLNAEYARRESHPDVVLDPMLVLATSIGLSVEDLSEIGGPFLGVNNVRFIRQVYPNDTITCSSEVLETRESRSRDSVGIVTWRTTAKNQRSEVVLSYERTNLVAKRGSQA